MINLKDYFKFGISPSMLYPDALTDAHAHLVAVGNCCMFDEYESFETFLPDDPEIRKLEIAMMKSAGKTLHYNSPPLVQEDGINNSGSDVKEYRENAVTLMKRHLEYASEAEAPFLVITGCPDKGPEKRSVLFERYEEYFCKVAEIAKPLGIRLVIEPIEREQFKKLILGPTSECAAFLELIRAKGYGNVGLMMDVMHLPLMGEKFDEALEISMKSGLSHIHLGDTVLEEGLPFFGHTHPPFSVEGGYVNQKELTLQFRKLLECGYIKTKIEKEKRPTISLEMRPYIGVSERTSARVFYERVESAFDCALKEHLREKA